MVDDASVVCEVSLPTTHWLTVSRRGYPTNSGRLLFVRVLVSQTDSKANVRLRTVDQLTTSTKAGTVQLIPPTL